MTDDIVTRLRIIHCAADDLTPCGTCLTCQAADEIERLRAALQIAAGKLSTLPPYTDWHPEIIYKALLEDGTQEARRG